MAEISEVILSKKDRIMTLPLGQFSEREGTLTPTQTAVNPATRVMQILGYEKALIGIGRGLTTIPAPKNFKAGIMVLAEFGENAGVQIAVRQLNFLENEYDIPGGADPNSSVIFLYFNKEIDEEMRVDLTPENATQVLPNVRSLHVLANGTPSQKKRELVRLHVRLRHLPADRFVPILRTAGFIGEVLKWAAKVSVWCKACHDGSKPNLEPKVSVKTVDLLDTSWAWT
jgi:hypothetical protein